MDDNGSKERDHQQLLVNVSKSYGAVWTAAQWLSIRGHAVVIKPSKVLATDGYNSRMKYTDSGDLEVNMRVEVKERSFTFSSAMDWPYRSIIICAKHVWDKALQKPYAFIYVSKDGENLAIVYGSSHRRWIIEVVKDGRYEAMQQECYVAPLEYAHFEKVK